MYAIIEVGGKQLNVKKGDIVEVEKQAAAAGDELKLDKVLLVSKDDETVEIGTPYCAKAVVQATVLGQTKGEKTVAFKYRRRKSSHTKIGHRQQLTRLKINEIKFK